MSSSVRFDPDSIQSFVVHQPTIDFSSGQVDVTTSLDGTSFVERLVFPLPDAPLADDVSDTVQRLVELLAVAVGVSYYKAAAPPRVVIDVPLGAAAQAFVAELYTDGLSEFAYRNALTLNPEIVFSPARAGSVDAAVPTSTRPALSLRPLVPIGGGKDSFVTYDLLRASGADPVGFSVKDPPAIRRALDALEGPSLVAHRIIDPGLISLNNEGARNGHVPVTAIVSLMALVTAALHGNDAVLLSNESSADEGNLVIDGHVVNHQWAKSSRAETLLRAAVREVAPNAPDYASFLRPVGELRIARAFARRPDRLDVFTSCNSVFRIDPAVRGTSWCRNCPKCRFVFLALATCVSRSRLREVFGGDLLDDVTQTDGYRELLGITNLKPFECVGTVTECRVAFDLAASGEWKDASVIHELRSMMADVEPEERSAVLGAFGDHAVPARYAPALELL